MHAIHLYLISETAFSILLHNGVQIGKVQLLIVQKQAFAQSIYTRSKILIVSKIMLNFAAKSRIGGRYKPQRRLR